MYSTETIAPLYSHPFYFQYRLSCFLRSRSILEDQNAHVYLNYVKERTYNHEIDPDEIFLDSHNLPEFDIHQFEERIERPISKQAVALMGIVFMLQWE